MPSHSQPTSTAERGSLYRRNTNEAAMLPNLTPIGQQPGATTQGTQISGGVEYPASVSQPLNHTNVQVRLQAAVIPGMNHVPWLIILFADPSQG